MLFLYQVRFIVAQNGLLVQIKAIKIKENFEKYYIILLLQSFPNTKLSGSKPMQWKVCLKHFLMHGFEPFNLVFGMDWMGRTV